MGATSENNALSAQDRVFIASEKMYPGRIVPTDPTVQDLEVSIRQAHEIAHGRRRGRLPLRGRRPGRHVIETSGSTDVVTVLFGPNNHNLKIAEDDDGGEGRNSRIAADLDLGRVPRRRPPLQSGGARRLSHHGERPLTGSERAVERAAVEQPVLPDDEAGMLRAEEGASRAELLRRAVAAGRNRRRAPRARLVHLDALGARPPRGPAPRPGRCRGCPAVGC